MAASRIVISKIFNVLISVSWETNAIAPDGTATICKDHKIQTDKRARFSSGGVCHGSVGCQRGSKSASGAISPVWTSTTGGAPRDGKPLRAALPGKSESVWSLQKQEPTDAGSIQQHDSATAQQLGESRGKSANPSTRVARKQAMSATSFFTAQDK